MVPGDRAELVDPARREVLVQQMTIAFVSLSGFKAYAEDRGDDAAMRVLRDAQHLLQAAADGHGAKVARRLGNRSMVWDADLWAVVHCVLEARDAVATRCPLPLRAGIACGQAIRLDGGEYVGRTVKLASRLAGRAKPNQVLAAVAVAAQVRSLVVLRPCPALPGSGFAEPIAVHELAATTSRDRVQMGVSTG